MPLPYEPDSHRQPNVDVDSPRDALHWAILYRRRIRRRPGFFWRRVFGLVGTLLLHLFVLIFVLLGPAYQPPDEPDSDLIPLLVTLPPKKIPPPPPPPAPPVRRGTPADRIGPRYHGVLGKTHQVRPHAASAMQSTQTQAATAVPSSKPPVIVPPTTLPAAPTPKSAAAPAPPVSMPRPSPAPKMAPIPVTAAPPPISVNTPSTASPVPPKFQPEPVRKPQAEGNQPMPPPASLATATLPAQSRPTVTPPTVNVPAVQAQPTVTPITVPPTQVTETAAPPTPELQPVPLPAQPLSTVNLSSDSLSPLPNTARQATQVQAPSIKVAEVAQPALTPPATLAMQAIEAPRAAAVDSAAVQAQVPKLEATVSRPQWNPVRVATPDVSTSEASAAKAQQASEPQTASASAAAANDTQAQTKDLSTAPDAIPMGSKASTHGEPKGSATAPQLYNRDGSLNLGTAGQGINPSSSQGQTGQGQSGQTGASSPNGSGSLGSFIQVRPHGNTDVMTRHARPIDYKATRFEQDWTPPHESSVDTAMRHAVEKTTIRHTFDVHGVRVNCVVMPLLPSALFGCGSGNPPPKPAPAKIYDRMHLQPLNASIPSVPEGPAPAASTVAPVKLDNAAQCAAARVSGLPLPAGCPSDTFTPSKPATPAPAPAASSWVKPSDQF